MRENQILNISVFAAIFLAFSLANNTVISGGYAVSWVMVGGMLSIAGLLLALISYMTRYLSKERITTTIA